jgi:hypothetical protein
MLLGRCPGMSMDDAKTAYIAEIQRQQAAYK